MRLADAFEILCHHCGRSVEIPVARVGIIVLPNPARVGRCPRCDGALQIEWQEAAEEGLVTRAEAVEA